MALLSPVPSRAYPMLYLHTSFTAFAFSGRKHSSEPREKTVNKQAISFFFHSFSPPVKILELNFLIFRLKIHPQDIFKTRPLFCGVDLTRYHGNVWLLNRSEAKADSTKLPIITDFLPFCFQFLFSPCRFKTL